MAEQHSAREELRLASRADTMEHLRDLLASIVLHLDSHPRRNLARFMERRVV